MLRSRRLRIQTFFSRPKKKKKKTFFFQKDDFESVSNQDQFDSIPNDSNDSNSVNSGDESPQSPPHKRACYENHAEQMPLHAGFKAPRSGKYFYYPHGVDGVFFRPVWQVLPQQQRVQQRMHRPAAYAAKHARRVSLVTNAIAAIVGTAIATIVDSMAWCGANVAASSTTTAAAAT
jgi:hypothetical protein